MRIVKRSTYKLLIHSLSIIKHSFCDAAGTEAENRDYVASS
jgi:hypothetical protein